MEEIHKWIWYEVELTDSKHLSSMSYHDPKSKFCVGCRADYLDSEWLRGLIYEKKAQKREPFTPLPSFKDSLDESQKEYVKTLRDIVTICWENFIEDEDSDEDEECRRFGTRFRAKVIKLHGEPKEPAKAYRIIPFAVEQMETNPFYHKIFTANVWIRDQFDYIKVLTGDRDIKNKSKNPNWNREYTEANPNPEKINPDAVRLLEIIFDTLDNFDLGEILTHLDATSRTGEEKQWYFNQGEAGFRSLSQRTTYLYLPEIKRD